MAIDVHTDTNNNVVIDVQARSTQANVDVVPNTPAQNDVETYPIYGPKGDKGDKGEKGDKGDKGDPGTTDYNELINKPIFSTGLTDNNNTITVTNYNRILFNNGTGTNSLAVGSNSSATKTNAIAIGNNASARKESAIQIGAGTNTTASSLKVGFRDVSNPAVINNYELLDGETGKIPAERIKTFVFEQGIASDTWVIHHNLNKKPSVVLVDSTDTEFIAQVEYNDNNTLTVYLNGATKGKAYLN